MSFTHCLNLGGALRSARTAVMACALAIGLLSATEARVKAQQTTPQTALSFMPVRSLGMVASDVADARDPRGLNPAAGFIDGVSELYANYAPTPTGIEGSWSGSAGGAWRATTADEISVMVGRYQYQDVYAETGAALSYIHAFHVDRTTTTDPDARTPAEPPGMATGAVRVHYSQERFGGPYLPLTDLSVDAGMSVPLTHELALGAAVEHLTSLYQDQNLPSGVRTEYLGIAYHPSVSDLSVALAIESQGGDATGARVGFAYQFDPAVGFRAGYETVTGRFAMGLGLRLTPLTLDVAFTHDNALGGLLAFGMVYLL